MFRLFAFLAMALVLIVFEPTPVDAQCGSAGLGRSNFPVQRIQDSSVTANQNRQVAPVLRVFHRLIGARHR